MNNLHETTLGECVDLVIDHRGKTPAKMGGDWTDDGVRVISAANVHNGSIDNVDQIRCVSEEIYNKWMSEDICRNDCFIASEGASLGENCIWDSDEKIVLGQRLYAIRTNASKLDPWCFAAYMQTKRFRAQIDQISTGSTVFGVSQPVLLGVKLLLPSIDVQKRIGHLYMIVKRKIENNLSICERLEELAKDLYNYWFLQFDFPNDSGKPYKTSGGKMEWNKELKRSVPVGWKTTTIGDITLCHDSKRVPLSANQREEIAGDIPYYGATDIMGYVNRAIFSGDYVLMAEDGSVMDREGHPVLQRITGDTWVNNHAHVLEPINGYSCKLLMMLLKDIYVPSIKTGSIQMKINQENMNGIVVVDIPKDLRIKINRLLEPIDNKIIDLQKENQELVKLRDFLLPMLFNGQVSFR